MQKRLSESKKREREVPDTSQIITIFPDPITDKEIEKEYPLVSQFISDSVRIIVVLITIITLLVLAMYFGQLLLYSEFLIDWLGKEIVQGLENAILGPACTNDRCRPNQKCMGACRGGDLPAELALTRS